MKAITPIKIMPVADQPAYHEAIDLALKGCPEFLVCEGVMNGAELLEKLETETPDMILMDSCMPVMDGMEATKKVKERYPQIKVLAHSSLAGLADIMEMMQAGADGYILKSAGSAELKQALKTIMDGNTYFGTGIKETISQVLFREESKTSLQAANDLQFTENEKAILQLICQEYTSHEIAAQLFMSLKTVEKHRATLMTKTNSRNMAGLVLYAFEHGLYHPTK